MWTVSFSPVSRCTSAVQASGAERAPAVKVMRLRASDRPVSVSDASMHDPLSKAWAKCGGSLPTHLGLGSYSPADSL